MKTPIGEYSLRGQRSSQSAAINSWRWGASRKVARKQLPDHNRSRPAGLPPAVEPESELEKLVVAVWSEVLETDDLGLEDDFFDLGGDSLDALRVALLLQERLEMELDEAAILIEATPAGIARAIADAMKG